MNKLGADELRKSDPSKSDLKKIKRNPIYLVIDEVLDTYNIGSMFRLADATAMQQVFLSGEMEYPPSIKIHRAAVGTDKWVPWEKVNSAAKVVKKLKKQGVQIVVIEQHKKSISYSDFKPKFPVALVVGHETKGVSKKVIKQADVVVELPMLGINKSFNVWGTAAVMAYKLLEYLNNK